MQGELSDQNRDGCSRIKSPGSEKWRWVQLAREHSSMVEKSHCGGQDPLKIVD